MYDDPYLKNQGGPGGFLRLLAASFRLGRFFGVEVRVYWVALIIMPLIVMPRINGPFLEQLTYTALLTVFLYLIIYAHEMSHIVAGWRYRIRTSLITLSPLGGTAHMSAPAPNPRAEAVISLAGPASHLIWLLVFAPLWFFVVRDSYTAFDLLRPDGWTMGPVWFAVYILYSFNIALMVFNLLPFFPMDGGRTLRAFLAMKMHPNRATMIATQVGILGAALFIIGGFAYLFMGGGYGGILIALGISNWMACVQERRAAKYTAGPYSMTAQSQPWQADPDAWKHSREEPSKDPGYFEKRRRKKADEQQRRDREDATTLAAEVDRILEKVNRVGMSGLTEAEKKTLMRASKSGKRR